MFVLFFYFVRWNVGTLNIHVWWLTFSSFFFYEAFVFFVEEHRGDFLCYGEGLVDEGVGEAVGLGFGLR